MRKISALWYAGASMLRRRLCFPALLAICAELFPASSAEVAKPKLVVAIIVDQFRYDYLTRFRSEYRGGFDRMLTKGADFTNAFYAQVPTVTAVGHSIFMSGAMPALSGIVSNAWYDRDEGQIVTSVCDWNEKTVGGRANETKGSKCTDADPASPRRLLVSTLGDELRAVNTSAKVVGISIKARAAIMPSGHLANGAFWFDDTSGHFVSSTYYMQQLPEWAQKFNGKDLGKSYVKRKWEGFPDWDFTADPGTEPYSKLAASPWGNELIEQFAEAAIDGENLGKRSDNTDLLTVSFSSNDYVGHRVGPDAPEVKDMSIRTDKLLAKLFDHLQAKVGMENVIVVLSADHGVAAAPEYAAQTRMPGGYVAADPEDAVQSALNREFGQAAWLVPGGGGETSLYFDRDAIAKVKTSDGKPVQMDDVYRVARKALFDTPLLHVARVYTRPELERGAAGDFVAQAEMNGFFPRRSGDIMVVFEPGFVPGTSGTTHFSPYSYDRHVPVLFLGPGIKAGDYNGTIMPNDIAPTLATILHVQTPSGSSGRVLTEMLDR
jgi:hypothetical protein